MRLCGFVDTSDLGKYLHFVFTSLVQLRESLSSGECRLELKRRRERKKNWAEL